MRTLTSHEWDQRFVQQAGWTKEIRKYLLSRVNMESGTRILDVGCGTGIINKELEKYEAAQFGLDIKINHLKIAAKNCSSTRLIQGDAHWLPFADGVFDAVICHYLLMWILNPQEALYEMSRVTRSGGYIMAFAEPDYGGRIDYPPQLEILGELQAKSLQRQGANPLMGRQLARLFNGVGLDSVEAGVLGGQWSGPPDWESFTSEWQVIEADRIKMPEIFPEIALQELKEMDRTATQKKERLLYVPTFYACGIVR